MRGPYKMDPFCMVPVMTLLAAVACFIFFSQPLHHFRGTKDSLARRRRQSSSLDCSFYGHPWKDKSCYSLAFFPRKTDRNKNSFKNEANFHFYFLANSSFSTLRLSLASTIWIKFQQSYMNKSAHVELQFISPLSLERGVNAQELTHDSFASKE